MYVPHKMSLIFAHNYTSVNRFAGTRLEELKGEIPQLCKDQHGCRYLQKKLEESVPEHRDMIFRETFGHFADLMTGMYVSNFCAAILMPPPQTLLATTSARSY
jgi:Pumilio-family RNA binding repeat